MPTSLKYNLVVVCSEPGGANALAPVIKKLKRHHEIKVHALANNKASPIWENHNIYHDLIDEEISMDKIKTYLKNKSTSLLLTGSSGIYTEQKRFIKAARFLNIPSIAIMDFWSNYIQRFSDNNGDLSFMPDIITVIDDKMKDDMINVGFDPEKLIITGNPAHDDLYRWKNLVGSKKIIKIRDDLGIPQNDLMILFASQPLSTLYGTNDSNPLYLGYSEKSVLKVLINCLESMQLQVSKKIFLVIRPHPSEKVEDYTHIHSNVITIITSTEGYSRDYVIVADIVIGMTTMLLVEACYLDRPVISLQPNLLNEDPLPTNQIGLSIGIYSEEKIFPTLLKVIHDIESENKSALINKANFQTDNCSTRSIISIIYKLLENQDYVLC